jgi:atypical dual specificity phosphatase
MALPDGRDLSRLRRMGITLLVSVVSTPLDRVDVRRARLDYLHLPVMYLRAPTSEQIQTFITAADAHLAAGGKVAVHCVGGIGRTGTVIGCYLVEQGMTARQAIDALRQARPGSVESVEQEMAVYQWASSRSERTAVALPALAAPGPDAAQVLPDAAWEAVQAIPERPDEPPPPAALSQPETIDGEGVVTPMTRVAQTGYLKWHPDGAGVDIRALSPGPGESPRVEDLKSALQELSVDDQITVTLTETLGKSGEAWMSATCPAGGQGALLVTTGAIVNMLVAAGLYDEVLLSSE